MKKIFKESIEQAILTGCATAVSEFVYVDVGHVMAVIGKEKTIEICKVARGLEEVDLKTENEIVAEGEPEIREMGVGKFDRIELLEALGYFMEVKPEDRPKLVVPEGLTKKNPSTPLSPSPTLSPTPTPKPLNPN